MSWGRKILVLAPLLLFNALFSQVHKATGIVKDSLTQEPLAFVSVSIIGQQKGVLTDIDGKFLIQSEQGFSSLQLNYVGYKSKLVRCRTEAPLVISLSQSKILLHELVILAGENPAHRIIRKTIERKALNNPENLKSFKYETYNKFVYTVGEIKKQKHDTVDPGFEKFIGRSHLFMMESVTERKFKQPEHSKEIVKATKVSGFQDPSFALMATEFQSFSFYSDIIKVNNKNYVNPISKGTFNRYFFLIKDTVFEGNDTVFVISFQPKKDKNFDALKGLLYINTHGFALENVIAEPGEDHVFKGKTQIDMGIKIQQKYGRIGEVWFPVQLNADLSVRTGLDSTRNMTILGISRSYIRDIQINPDLPNSDFDHVVLDYAKDAAHKDSAFWKQYRVDTLNLKERTTYHEIDSMGKKYHLDKKINFLGYLTVGQIPYGKISIDMNQLFGYNQFEGFRAGLGVHTNDRLSDYFTVGGYYAYAFKPGLHNYGYDGALHLNKRHELDIGGAYYKDVVEMGAVRFYNNFGSLLSNENLRNYLVNRMDKIENKEVFIGFRALTYANVRLTLATFGKTVTSGYFYTPLNVNTYNFTTFKVAMRYAYAERYIKSFNRLVPVASKYPVLWAQVTKGIKGLQQGMFDYNKVDVKVQHRFFIKGIGAPSMQITTGMVDRVIPLSEMYTAQASLGTEGFGIRVFNTFQTMRMNEFYSQRYISFCFSNNFGKLLYKGKKFQPQLEWSHNILIGDMNNVDSHAGIDFKVPSKGYFETGFSVNNIYKSGFSGYGLGLFYRYGPYSFSDELKNFALILTYSLEL